MPALKGNRKQLTTEEFNSSRFVTKIRWVVEAVHGVIAKKYKLLHHQLDNKLLPKVGLYCKIACYLNNSFGPRMISDMSRTEDIVQRMLLPQPTTNTLANEVEEQRWARRKVDFKNVTLTDIPDFPELTEEDLIFFWNISIRSGYFIFSRNVYIKQQHRFTIFKIKANHPQVRSPFTAHKKKNL